MALPSMPSIPMSNKCTECGLVNFAGVEKCGRCEAPLVTGPRVRPRRKGTLLVRVLICICVVFAAVLSFYLSLLFSAQPLNIDQKASVRRGISILREKGFTQEAFLLANVTVYRSNDNWLNASVAKENAYAATNFPFEIMTVYPDFFAYPKDDVERAAILLHEAKHLQGKDEHDAYAFVWKQKARLGWTREAYGASPIWENVRRQTLDMAPEVFTCPDREFNDCVVD